MNKKLLFIIPPTLNMGEIAKKMRVQNATIPYGVLSISAYVIDRYPVDVKIIDMNVGKYVNTSFYKMYRILISDVLSFSPNIIGISLMYNHMYKYGHAISSLLRKALPKEILIVAGGCCVMAYFDRILEDSPNLDAICFSEGEIPILDLLRADNPSKLLEEHPSWATKSTILKGKKNSASFVENLDEIPPIDFNLIDLSLYGPHRTSFRPIRKKQEGKKWKKMN